MSSGKDFSLTVRDFFSKGNKELKLEWRGRQTGREKKIFPDFPYKVKPAVHILRKDEYDRYQSFSPRKKQGYFKRLSNKGTAAIIGTKNLHFSAEFENAAKENEVALFITPLSATECEKQVKKMLAGALPNQAIISGGVLEVFGIGIIIIGDSGVGKSESALELISHGHKFVSDDVTLFYLNQNGLLCGSAPDISKNYMEIRGLGIINIKEIFSDYVSKDRAKIELVIKLKRWEEGKQYDRLGLKFPKKHEILGKKLPLIVIPVAPGRNIAMLIEVACKVHILRKRGINVSMDMINKANDQIWKQTIK
ncbi:MAG: HPr(Ser) kinase/phosphatase [Candidatus Aminicenantes bacterium]|nr:HPr(Ser) kinase/phosphatase [Candidatus Aminicenantes bacterium]